MKECACRRVGNCCIRGLRGGGRLWLRNICWRRPSVVRERSGRLGPRLFRLRQLRLGLLRLELVRLGLLAEVLLRLEEVLLRVLWLVLPEYRQLSLLESPLPLWRELVRVLLWLAVPVSSQSVSKIC